MLVGCGQKDEGTQRSNKSPKRALTSVAISQVHSQLIFLVSFPEKVKFQRRAVFAFQGNEVHSFQSTHEEPRMRKREQFQLCCL